MPVPGGGGSRTWSPAGCKTGARHYGSRVSTPRAGTLAGTLARMGFAEPARAEHLITEGLRLEADGAEAEVLAAIAAGADPGLALAALTALLQRSWASLEGD